MREDKIFALIVACFLFLAWAMIYGVFLAAFNRPAWYFLNFLAMICSITAAVTGSIGFYFVESHKLS